MVIAENLMVSETDIVSVYSIYRIVGDMDINFLRIIQLHK